MLEFVFLFVPVVEEEWIASWIDVVLTVRLTIGERAETKVGDESQNSCLKRVPGIPGSSS